MKKFNFIFVFLMIFTSLLFVGCGSKDKKDEIIDNFYLNETMSYDDIDVIVSGLSEKIATSGEHSGNYILSVSVTLKNNRSKDFKFDYPEIYIKTEDTGQKYEVSYGFDYAFGDTIISGAKKDYVMNFYTPYSYKETNFIIYFDWGVFSKEHVYYLYDRSLAEERLQYELTNDGSAYIVKGIGGYKKSEILIPDLFKDLPIIEVSDNAFKDNTFITSVNIGNNISKIGQNAFYGCTNITNVQLGTGIITLDSSCFYNCTSLSTINLPNTILSIGGNAFYNCSKLTNISLPSELTSLNYGVFHNCSSITEITLGNKIKVIESYALTGTSIKVLNIPSSLEKMVGVQSIDTLEKVKIEDIDAWCNIEFDYFNAHPLYNKNAQLYIGEDVVENLVLSSDVSKISQYAFYNCTSLKSIEIPSNVEIIGAFAFEKCSNLKNVKLDEGIKEIGAWCFDECINIEEIIIPRSCTKLHGYIFEDCFNLKKVTLPQTTFRIEKESGIYRNEFLPAGYLFGALEYNSSDYYYTISQIYKLTSNWDYKYENTNYRIPKSLKTIIITDESIGCGAFSGFKYVENILLTENVKTIDSYAFSECTGINNLYFSRGITDIEDRVLSGCSNLKEVTISYSVTEIGAYIFENCSSLTNIIFEDDTNWEHSTDYSSWKEINLSDSQKNVELLLDFKYNLRKKTNI